MRDAINDTFCNNSSITQMNETQKEAIPWGTVLTNRSNYPTWLESGREEAYLWTSVGRREAGRQ
jgi:hypothetical protein